MLHNKLEFWILSVPALIVSIGAVAHYGAWMLLWAIPVPFCISTTVQLIREMIIEVLDRPRTNACRAGNWPKAYGFVVLIALYNCLVLTWLPDVIYAFIVWRYKGAMPLPFACCWVYALSFALPSLARILTRRTDGSGVKEVLVELERVALLGAIGVAVSVSFTLPQYLAGVLLILSTYLVWAGIRWYKSEHVKFMRYWEAEKKGVPFDEVRNRKWFPREGVIFEPQGTPTGFSAKVAGGDWGTLRRSMIVYSVSPMAFVTLALLVVGACVLIDNGRWIALLSFPLSMVLLFLLAAYTADPPKQSWFGTIVRCFPYVFTFFWLAAIEAWLGTDRLLLQIATAAFLVGSLEFPMRYIVKGNSEKNPDWLCPLATIAALAVAILVRRSGGAWYACGFCATVAAYPLALARHFWPVKPLVLPSGANTAQPDGDSEKRARRERKRERQIAALRRSQHG